MGGLSSLRQDYVRPGVPVAPVPDSDLEEPRDQQALVALTLAEDGGPCVYLTDPDFSTSFDSALSAVLSEELGTEWDQMCETDLELDPVVEQAARYFVMLNHLEDALTMTKGFLGGFLLSLPAPADRGEAYGREMASLAQDLRFASMRMMDIINVALSNKNSTRENEARRGSWVDELPSAQFPRDEVLHAANYLVHIAQVESDQIKRALRGTLHDVRGMIGVVVHSAEYIRMLLEDGNDDWIEMHGVLDESLQCVERGLLYVDGAFQEEAEQQMVNVESVCVENATLFNAFKGLEVHYDPTFMREGMPKVSELGLSRILTNLCRNAADAGAKNLRMTLYVHGEKEFTLMVQDDGPGFPEGVNPFTKEEMEDDALTGNGFIICKQLAEGMGLRIALTNAGSGEGACFEITNLSGADESLSVDGLAAAVQVMEEPSTDWTLVQLIESAPESVKALLKLALDFPPVSFSVARERLVGTLERVAEVLEFETAPHLVEVEAYVDEGQLCFAVTREGVSLPEVTRVAFGIEMKALHGLDCEFAGDWGDVVEDWEEADPWTAITVKVPFV